VDAIGQDLLDAVERGDWTTVKSLLHPYLHWKEPGVTLRGRTNVLGRLAESPPPSPPSTVDLRDGQIYRWTATSAPDGG
jgi:hypothetical protein